MNPKFKIWDRVRIVSSRDGLATFNPEGEMDKYLGKIMTIKKYYLGHYEMEEDSWMWYWFEDMIEWLAEEEWKPKEGDMVKVGLDDERIFLYTTNIGIHIVVCYWEEDKYRNWRSFNVTTYDKIFKDEKKERKLMMTDSEWEIFQKNNNL